MSKGNTFQVCVRVDLDMFNLLNTLKKRYGIEFSSAIRLAMNAFLPRLLKSLEELESLIEAELAKELILDTLKEINNLRKKPGKGIL